MTNQQPPSKIHSIIETPDKLPAIIPPVPPRKISKKELKTDEDVIEKGLNIFKPPKSKLEQLYWRVSWLQFISLTISFWSVVIATYTTGKGFFHGFSDVEVINAIKGTLISFTSVVLGAMAKRFNQQIDEVQSEREDVKDSVVKLRRENEIYESDQTKKEKRIIDLESQILSMSLKFQNMLETQTKNNSPSQ